MSDNLHTMFHPDKAKNDIIMSQFRTKANVPHYQRYGYDYISGCFSFKILDSMCSTKVATKWARHYLKSKSSINISKTFYIKLLFSLVISVDQNAIFVGNNLLESRYYLDYYYNLSRRYSRYNTTYPIQQIENNLIS